MNKYICIGNLTKDSELKYLPTGTALLSFDIAVNSRITKDKTEVCYWKCKLFGKVAEALNPYLNKGQKVLVEARVVDNSWTKQDGTKQTFKELAVEKIEFIGSKSGGQNSNNQVNNKPTQNNYDVGNEDIPF
jgi:single-strand DNA-binding protein